MTYHHSRPARVAAALAPAAFSFAVVTLALAVGNPVLAQSSLPPGTTSGIPVPIIATGTPPFGGTLLQEVQSSLFGSNGVNTISGMVTSAVFRSTSGFLDFAYQFSFDSSTNIVVDAISLSPFDNVSGLSIGQTAEDIDGAGLPAESLGNTVQNNFGPATSTGSFSSASRPNVNGNGINATLLTGVTGNQTTYTLFIRTEVTGFAVIGSASAQGGGVSGFTPAQGLITPLAPTGPTEAPEPASLALLAGGMLAPLAGVVRRRRKASRRS